MVTINKKCTVHFDTVQYSLRKRSSEDFLYVLLPLLYTTDLEVRGNLSNKVTENNKDRIKMVLYFLHSI